MSINERLNPPLWIAKNGITPLPTIYGWADANTGEMLCRVKDIPDPDLSYIFNAKERKVLDTGLFFTPILGNFSRVPGVTYDTYTPGTELLSPPYINYGFISKSSSIGLGTDISISLVVPEYAEVSTEFNIRFQQNDDNSILDYPSLIQTTGLELRVSVTEELGLPVYSAYIANTVADSNISPEINIVQLSGVLERNLLPGDVLEITLSGKTLNISVNSYTNMSVDLSTNEDWDPELQIITIFRSISNVSGTDTPDYPEGYNIQVSKLGLGTTLNEQQ